MAFRCNIAYTRYWEAVTHMYQMRHRWSAAYSLIVEFDSPADETDHRKCSNSRSWRMSVAHLFSLLHAVTTLELKQMRMLEVIVDKEPYAKTTCAGLVSAMFPWARALLVPIEVRHLELQVEVIGGIEPEEQLALEASGFKSGWIHFVHVRLLRVLVARSRAGGLDMPPPIVSRLFSQLELGVEAAVLAQMISHTPFPYPFYELMRWMKWYFVLTLPLLIASQSQSVASVLTASVIASVLFVSLLEVSEELEDPFGEDANDLPLLALHADFNFVIKELALRRTLDVDEYTSEAARSYRRSLVRKLFVGTESRSSLDSETDDGMPIPNAPSAALIHIRPMQQRL
mmetsp:Transcript_8825/g.22489  ORF Transcript_8825/g.22489 Transcript_8825/m.22489 type:complete len:343 (+) Transcript_8825:2-1030(+)